MNWTQKSERIYTFLHLFISLYFVTDALQNVRVALAQLANQPIYADIDLSVNNQFFGKSIVDAIDSCIRHNDRINGIELFQTQELAEAFRQRFNHFHFIPDQTPAARRVLYDTHHVLDLMRNENHLINVKLDRKARVRNWVYCRLTAMNGNPVRQNYYNKVPIPSPKFVTGIIYPRFKLDATASSNAQNVILQTLKTVDVIVKDPASRNEVRYASNNTLPLSRARTLKLPCKTIHNRHTLNIGQCSGLLVHDFGKASEHNYENLLFGSIAGKVLRSEHGDSRCVKAINSYPPKNSPLRWISNELWNRKRDLCIELIKRSFESKLPRNASDRLRRLRRRGPRHRLGIANRTIQRNPNRRLRNGRLLHAILWIFLVKVKKLFQLSFFYFFNYQFWSLFRFLQSSTQWFD